MQWQRRIWGLGTVFLVIASISSQARGQTAPERTSAGPTFRIPGEGFRGDLGPFTYRVRTRLHLDLVDSRLGDVGDALGQSYDNTTDVRRARILADFGFRDGSAFEPFRLRAHFDFADSVIDWKDLALEFHMNDAGPWQRSKVRLGQFREPFGVEAMTSVTHLPFIERSIASNTFTPGRSRGAQWSVSTERALLQVGHFRRADGVPFPNELLEESSTTLRALVRPADSAVRQFGGSVSLRDPGGDRVRLGGRPGTRLLPRVVDTTRFDAESLVTAGVEGLVQSGRFTSYAEWFGAWADLNGEDAFLTGGHVAFTAFLGSGSTTWNRHRGGLRAPHVEDAVYGTQGSGGAWEAAVRATWVDLDDGSLRGGRSFDIEAGLNWYVQPSTRLMLHWVGLRSDAPGGERSTGSAILGRVQIQF